MVHYNAHIGNGGGLLFLSENVPFKDMISNHTNKFSMTQWLIFENNILWIYVKPMWLISRRVRTNLCIKKTSNNADVYPPEVDCTLLFPLVMYISIACDIYKYASLLKIRLWYQTVLVRFSFRFLISVVLEILVALWHHDSVDQTSEIKSSMVNKIQSK